MAYYIKTIGIRDEKISIAQGRFPRMLLFHMCFKTDKGKIKSLKKGDKLVIYTVINGIKEFLSGGFIGTQVVLGKYYKNTQLFKKPWHYIVDIQPEIYSLIRIIKLKEIKAWKGKSIKLKKALRVGLLAKSGLLKIGKNDYKKFLVEFKKRTAVKAEDGPESASP